MCIVIDMERYSWRTVLWKQQILYDYVNNVLFVLTKKPRYMFGKEIVFIFEWWDYEWLVLFILVIIIFTFSTVNNTLCMILKIILLSIPYAPMGLDLNFFLLQLLFLKTSYNISYSWLHGLLFCLFIFALFFILHL